MKEIFGKLNFKLLKNGLNKYLIFNFSIEGFGFQFPEEITAF